MMTGAPLVCLLLFVKLTNQLDSDLGILRGCETTNNRNSVGAANVLLQPRDDLDV